MRAATSYVVVVAALCLSALAARAQPMPDPIGVELSALATATHPRAGLHLTLTTRRPLFAAAAGEEALGTVLAGTEIVVLTVQKNRLRVRLDGWQQDAGSRAVYARRGLRILSVALTEEAAHRLRPGAAATDPATGMVWHAAQVTGWIDASGLVAPGAKLSRVMTELDTDACGSCHAVRPPGSLTAYQWAGGVSSNRHRNLLDADQMGLLLHWLQMGASDKGF